MRRQVVIDDTLMALKEVAIECPYTESIKSRCKMCNPTSAKLYTSDYYKDINLADPCEPIKSQQIDVKEITIDDNVYKYTTESEEAKLSLYKIVAYKYNDALASYVKIKEHEPIFHIILEKLGMASADIVLPI